MFEVKINKVDDLIIIKWQLSKVEIPISDIIRVGYDDTYSGSSNKVMRIGYPYGTTDRILIHTTKQDYLIYTSVGATKEKILSFMQ